MLINDVKDKACNWQTVSLETEKHLVKSQTRPQLLQQRLLRAIQRQLFQHMNNK
ncbi:MAG: hypothetical protein KME40_22735 [Komarekiella atlantica HA4396-MV6]|jgi:hypothetical protein|nr:hypothetical protein [Komarekiella atlantica HA4396-MV6]